MQDRAAEFFAAVYLCVHEKWSRDGIIRCPHCTQTWPHTELEKFSQHLRAHESADDIADAFAVARLVGSGLLNDLPQHAG